MLLTAEPAGAREVRKTAAGLLWPPLRARLRVPLSALVSLGGGPVRRVAWGLRRPGPRRVRLISLSLSAAALRPAEVVRASETRARLARGLRTGSSGGVRRLSPTSRAAGVTSLRPPGLGQAPSAHEAGLARSSSTAGAVAFPPGDVRSACASLTCKTAAECGGRVPGESVGPGQ